MLVFTEEQMIRLDEKARVHFHRRVRDHVREDMPEAVNTIPNTQLLAYIGEQDRIAAQHGIQTERGVSKWVCLSLGLGAGFYQEPEIKQYFNEPGPPPAEARLSILIDCMEAQITDPNVKLENIYAKHGYYIGGE